MTATEIVTAAVASGGSVSVAALALRGLLAALQAALPSLVAAAKARSDARAHAAKVAADLLTAARAHEDRVYDDLRRDVEDLRARLDESEKSGEECERKYGEAMARTDEMMRIALRQQREIDALRRLIERRGITPPEGMEIVSHVGGDEDA